MNTFRTDLASFIKTNGASFPRSESAQKKIAEIFVASSASAKAFDAVEGCNYAVRTAMFEISLQVQANRNAARAAR